MEARELHSPDASQVEIAFTSGFSPVSAHLWGSVSRRMQSGSSSQILVGETELQPKCAASTEEISTGVKGRGLFCSLNKY